MMRKVYLDGELGERFGRELTLNVGSFKDLFSLLGCNDPTVRDYLVECDKNNVGFFCKVGTQDLKEEKELLMDFNEGDMYVSAIPAGSGDGIQKLFAAVAILVATILLPPSAPAWLSKAGYYLSATLAMTGIAEIMAPDPATDESGMGADSSYLFQGSGQTVKEGDPVPLLYGRLRVPGRVVDFHLRNENANFLEAAGFGGNFTDLNPSDDNTGATDTSNVTIGGGQNSIDNSGGIAPSTPGQLIRGNIVETDTLSELKSLGLIVED